MNASSFLWSKKREEGEENGRGKREEGRGKREEREEGRGKREEGRGKREEEARRNMEGGKLLTVDCHGHQRTQDG
jgi:hypothetical protein